MKQTGDSLSDQNKSRRAAGAGLSPARPTLWQRLRKLDRECGDASKTINLCKVFKDLYPFCDYVEKATKRFNAADAKRKAMRIKMKQRPVK